MSENEENVNEDSGRGAIANDSPQEQKFEERKISVVMKGTAIQPPRLKNIKDWNRWSPRMIMYLRAMGLHNHIIRNTNMEGQEEFMVQNLIVGSISESIYSVIQNCTTASEMWSTLQEHCRGEASGEKLILRTKFENLSLPATKTVQKWVSEYQDLQNDMHQLSILPSEYEQCVKILNCLPKGTYKDFVTYHQYQLGDLTTTKLLALLRTEAINKNNWDRPYSQRRDHQGQHASFFNSSRRNGGGARDRNNKDRRGGGKGNGKRTLYCFRCWSTDHLSNSCPNAVSEPPSHIPLEVQAKAVSKRISAANITPPAGSTLSSPTDHPLTRFSYVNITMKSTSSIESGVLMGIDSCTSIHLFNDPAFFKRMKDMPPITTSTADNGSITTSRGGTVEFNIKNCDGSTSQLQLSGVYFSKEVPINLFSTTLFSEASSGGFTVCSKSGATIYDPFGARVFDAGILHNVPIAKIYPVNLSCKNILVGNTAELWHCRLGHVGDRILRNMKQDNMVEDFPYNPTKHRLHMACEGCIMGDQTKRPVARVKKNPRVMNPGEAGSTDLCGPFRTKSSRGNRYGQINVDIGSQFIITTGLASKVDHPQAIKDLVILLERQFSLNVKTIRADDAGEFRSSWFLDWLSSLGINLITSVAGAHQQNAWAESAIRHLFSAVRISLYLSNVPQKCWDYCMEYIAHTTNLRPRGSAKMTATEALLNYRPSVSHLRVFGAHCFVQSLKEHDKLKPTSVKGYLVGYNTDVLGSSPNGYLVYVPSEGRVYPPSRNVEFNEQPILERCKEFASSYRSRPSTPLIQAQTDFEDEATIDLAFEIPNFDEGDAMLSTRATTPGPADATTSTSPSSTAIIPSSTTATSESTDIANNSDHDGEEVEIPLRRSTRNRRPINRLNLFCTSLFNMCNSSVLPLLGPLSCTVFSKEPRTLKEALLRNDSHKWMEALEAEKQALERNNTYEIVQRPENSKVIPCTTVFKIKQHNDGTIDKYKVRVCARGDKQKYGVDYHETFAPVVRFETLRVIFAIATIMNWELGQMDVSSAYLYGDIDEIIHMEIPDGFYSAEKAEGKVLRLKKSLYGLKQAGKIWHDVLDKFLKSMGFVNSSLDRCAYYKYDENGKIIVAVYVDDLMFTASCCALMDWFRTTLATKFMMKDLGDCTFIVGLEIQRDQSEGKLSVTQRLYAEDVLTRLNVLDCHTSKTPLQHHQILYPPEEGEALVDEKHYRCIVGSLMYGMIGTRPDLAFAVGQLSRHLHQPSALHLKASQQTLRYWKSTKELGLSYEYPGNFSDSADTRATSIDPQAFSDADWAGDCQDSKSTSGYLITMAKAPIVWRSMKQSAISKSSTEAEVASSSSCLDDVLWVRDLLKFFGFEQTSPTKFYMDNTAAINMIKNGNTTSRNKYFRVRTDSLHDAVVNQDIELHHMRSHQLPADALTKSLTGPQLKIFCSTVHIKQPSTSKEGGATGALPL